MKPKGHGAGFNKFDSPPRPYKSRSTEFSKSDIAGFSNSPCLAKCDFPMIVFGRGDS
jgi:hypothetical protein